MAPLLFELSTATIACVVSTLGAQPAITPSSVAKMNLLAPEIPAAVTMKPLEPLNTMPVGLPPLPAEGVGICTTSACGLPAPSYSVEVPVPLFATQTNPNGLNARPQAFTRFGSTWSAVPDPSDTRLCC